MLRWVAICSRQSRHFCSRILRRDRRSSFFTAAWKCASDSSNSRPSRGRSSYGFKASARRVASCSTCLISVASDCRSRIVSRKAMSIMWAPLIRPMDLARILPVSANKNGLSNWLPNWADSSQSLSNRTGCMLCASSTSCGTPLPNPSNTCSCPSGVRIM